MIRLRFYFITLFHFFLIFIEAPRLPPFNVKLGKSVFHAVDLFFLYRLCKNEVEN